MDFNQVLIAGAVPGEIDILVSSGKFPHIQSLGVGNLEASLNAILYLNSHPEVKTVIFFGSCGAYPWAKYRIGEIVNIFQFRNFELASALGQSKQVSLTPLSIDFENLTKRWPNAICNAPASLTLLYLPDAPLPHWAEFDVENLETFGLARACEIQNVKLNALLTITNIVGPDGSKDWTANWRKGSNELQKAYLNTLAEI